MHLFLDESGSFVPADPPRPKVSCVAALAVPTEQVAELCAEFASWRATEFGAASEVKGSTLSEAHMAQVIELVARYDVLFDACSIDAGSHSPQLVEVFKQGQAAKLAATVGPSNLPSLRGEIASYVRKLQGLSNQLFIQWFCAIVLHQYLLERVINYYGQVRPQELASFVWRIDRKAQSLTAFEELWSGLGTLFLGHLLGQQPMRLIPGVDLSFLEASFPANEAEVAEGLARLDPALRDRARHGGELNALPTRDRAYEDSASSSGLQVVDILAAALTRACNNTLQERGWASLAKLIIRHNPQTLRFIALNEGAPSPSRRVEASAPWAPVVAKLHRGARPMPMPPGIVLDARAGP